MTLMTLTAAAALSLTSLSDTGAETPKTLFLAQAQPFVATQGVVGPQGDYMTTPDGCTYRRTQAPGYPPRWILVTNPHHLGRLGARGCKGML